MSTRHVGCRHIAGPTNTILWCCPDKLYLGNAERVFHVKLGLTDDCQHLSALWQLKG